VAILVDGGLGMEEERMLTKFSKAVRRCGAVVAAADSPSLYLGEVLQDQGVM
jgi:hypothetical protein